MTVPARPVHRDYPGSGGSLCLIPSPMISPYAPSRSSTRNISRSVGHLPRTTRCAVRGDSGGASTQQQVESGDVAEPDLVEIDLQLAVPVGKQTVEGGLQTWHGREVQLARRPDPGDRGHRSALHVHAQCLDGLAAGAGWGHGSLRNSGVVKPFSTVREQEEGSGLPPNPGAV